MTARQPEPDAQSVSMIAIQEQLDRLLSCSSFHNSRRYPKFLKYVVEKGVSGSLEELKERVIGVEVFERPTDYEPATDPIVRLVAGETRKRLAQYYLQTEHGDELRIDIPPGSYAPIFYWPQWGPGGGHDSLRATVDGEDEAATVPEIVSGPATGGVPSAEADLALAAHRAGTSLSHSHHIRTLLLAALAAVVLVAGLVGSIWWIRTAPERNLKAFWEPLFSANPSMLICIGDWANPAPGRSDRRYVGPYDLAALARLAGWLSSTSRQFSILMASDVTLTDLRAEPDILVGSSNNRWTPVIMSNARYQFRTDAAIATNYIVDMQAPGSHNSVADALQVPSDPAMSQELALVSRIASPATGQVELVVAGTGACGTVAASEFVTSPYYFKQFADRAPRDWKYRNIQILISTNVINGRSGPPQMLQFYLY